MKSIVNLNERLKTIDEWIRDLQFLPPRSNFNRKNSANYIKRSNSAIYNHTVIYCYYSLMLGYWKIHKNNVKK